MKPTHLAIIVTNTFISVYQEYNLISGLFYLKKKQWFQCNQWKWFIQSIFHRFLHIVPTFLANCGCPFKKMSPVSMKTIPGVNFRLARKFWSVEAQPTRATGATSMQTSNSQTGPGLVSTAGELPLPIQVHLWFPCPLLSYDTEHCHGVESTYHVSWLIQVVSRSKHGSNWSALFRFSAHYTFFKEGVPA